MRLLIRWLLLAMALLLIAAIYPGVAVAGLGSALIASLTLGLLNAVVRPILVVLTIPITLVTLGLFLFVINALLFWAASNILAGFHVTGFGAALIGSLMYSALAMLIDSAMLQA